MKKALIAAVILAIAGGAVALHKSGVLDRSSGPAASTKAGESCGGCEDDPACEESAGKQTDDCGHCEDEPAEPADDCGSCEGEQPAAADACGGCESDPPKPASAAAAQNKDSRMCGEHRVPERECAICQPARLASLQPGQGMKVRLESARHLDTAGIACASPTSGSSSAGTAVLARVRYNQNRLACVTSLVGGVIRSVPAELGQSVREGDVLAEIASREMADAKAEYLNARAQETLKESIWKREKQLAEKKISAEQESLAAEAEYALARNAVAAARQRLLNLGFSDADVRQVNESESATATFLIRAPFDGTIIERDAVIGESVEHGKLLLKLADLSTMWLELSVPQDMLQSVRRDSAVHVAFDALPATELPGTVFWVESAVDDSTLMFKALALLENPNGLLKSGMYARVTVLGDTHGSSTLRIPDQAVQRVDGKSFVFVRLSNDLYEIRCIDAGARKNKTIEISRGLQPDEQVVIAGSFALKSEALKSRLGAGCTDH